MNIKKNIISQFLFVSIFLYTPIFSVNTIQVSGIVQNVDGNLLPDVLLILKNQKKSVLTNRFGEFDFNKVFPNDTLLVSLEKYQDKQIRVASDMEINLFPKSDIQDQINKARNGETITIPSGKHYIYPDFNIDSTVALSINYKTDITIQGEIGSEIILKWEKADILLIHESNNIKLKNFKIGYHDSAKYRSIDMPIFDSASNFKAAFADARNQLGKDAIFKYKGKLFHTNNHNESTSNITPRNVLNIFKSYDEFLPIHDYHMKDLYILEGQATEKVEIGWLKNQTIGHDFKSYITNLYNLIPGKETTKEANLPWWKKIERNIYLDPQLNFLREMPEKGEIIVPNLFRSNEIKKFLKWAESNSKDKFMTQRSKQRASYNKSKNQIHYQNMYDDDMINMVGELYKDDIEYLNFTFEN